MSKVIGLLILASFGIVVFFTNCNQNVETNITSDVSNNISFVSSALVPGSIDVIQQPDPCSGAANFAICQANSSTQYLKIGKSATDTMASIVGNIGQTLGDIPDGNSGTTTDGKIIWNKTSDLVWSILQKGISGNPVAYIAVNNGTYTFKYNGNFSESDTRDQQIEVTLNFSSNSSWTADVFFANNVCDTTQPNAPSKIQIKVTRLPTGNGLWTGKAMMYSPRWQNPGASAITCSVSAGVSEITLYSNFAGNLTSTKEALYLIMPSVTSLPTATGFELSNFCSNFPSSCGGGGQPTASLLSSYPNNLCIKTVPASLEWPGNCDANAAVFPASFSSDSLWTPPNSLKIKTVTVPSVL